MFISFNHCGVTLDLSLSVDRLDYQTVLLVRKEDVLKHPPVSSVLKGLSLELKASNFHLGRFFQCTWS